MSKSMKNHLAENRRKIRNTLIPPSFPLPLFLPAYSFPSLVRLRGMGEVSQALGSSMGCTMPNSASTSSKKKCIEV